MNGQRVAYTILETEYDEQGYIPCIVREGETGYYRTDWRWGHDIAAARNAAARKNADLGLTPEDVFRLEVESMRHVSAGED